MPAVQGIPGPYRFAFYSYDCAEPMHVHVRRERKEAKFWLRPLRLEREGGFSGHELRTIGRIIEENRDLIERAWHEHCNP